MKIGIDAGSLAVPYEQWKLGVYQMSFNLLRALAKIDRENDYLLYSFRPIEKEVMLQLGPRMKNINALPRTGWNYWALPRQLYADRPAVFLGLSQALPHFFNSPAVVVVHDLGFERFPQYYEDSDRLRKITRWSTKKAKRIVSVSDFTKRDLLRLYPISKEKIRVIYEACDPIFKPQTGKKIKQIRAKYRLKNRYFLFVGAFKKSKNLPKTLVAFADFVKRAKNMFSLVLVGGNLWEDPLIDMGIENLNLTKSVSKVGYVPAPDLTALYSGAESFLSPSVYEGFGITFLEAMACGCPVIGGDNSAMKEVVGKAGILVNPQKEKEISLAMVKLSKDKKLRSGFVRKGFEQVKKFSWQKTAHEFLKLFQKISAD